MKDKKETRHKEVKVAVHKNGISADPVAIFNHPKNQAQYRKLREIMARARDNGSNR